MLASVKITILLSLESLKHVACLERSRDGWCCLAPPFPMVSFVTSLSRHCRLDGFSSFIFKEVYVFKSFSPSPPPPLVQGSLVMGSSMGPAGQS